MAILGGVASSCSRGCADRRRIVSELPDEPLVIEKLYDEIVGIQYGERPDKHGWVERIN